MKLQEVLDAISGGTPVKISADCKDIFAGCMADTLKIDFDRVVGPYLDRDVYRINTMDGFITLAV